MNSSVVLCEETPLRGGGHIATDASAYSSTIAASDNSQGNTSRSHSSGSSMDDTRRIIIKICIDFMVVTVGE